MTDRPMVFIDDGGVMHGNNERCWQGQRQVGEYFVPLLGGQSDAWFRANRVGACRLFEPRSCQRRAQAENVMPAR